MAHNGSRTALLLLVAAVVAAWVPIAWAPAAGAASVGYVRLAHLSPDTPRVDVWLTSFRDRRFSQVVRSVPYGTLSPFQRLRPGTYNVSMRPPGASGSSRPLLTTNLRVRAGGAYTVAGVGRRANLRLRVLTDDLRPPEPGTARLRLVQASSVARIVDVTTSSGRTLVTGAAFPSATPYVAIPARQWTLRLQPRAGRARPVQRSLDVKAGSIYTLLLLDKGARDLQLVVRTDAAGSAGTPVGSVAAGFGGLASRPPHPPARQPVVTFVGLLLAAAAIGAWRYGGRRAA